MIDIALVFTLVLFSLTIVTTLAYYKRIRRATTEYEEAKGVVDDVIVSFDKQLQRQEEHGQIVDHTIKSISVRSENIAERLDEFENRFNTRLSSLDVKVTGAAEIESLKNELTTLNNKIEDLSKAQEVSKLSVAAPLDVQIETAIPIRRERALAPLTDTELRVLEFIASGDEKTAPEVKDMIKLTREHTARLMKKLYEAGYLERRPEKIPYAYRVKEEMLKILKKTDISA